MRQTEGRSDPTTNVLDQLYHNEYNIKALGQGPALGAGYAFVFGKGFFSTVNLSLLYMWGYFKVLTEADYQSLSSSTTPYEWTNNPNDFGVSKDTRQMGINFEPSIGYKAENTGLIFTLGFRFQWLRSEFLDVAPSDELPTGIMNDYLGGIFISILYTF
jgi:hypothetical protein